MGMILDLLRSRYSVRKFQDRPIPANVLSEMLEAGRLSPSGGNAQSWDFGVITDRGLIAQIAEIACGQSWIAGAPLLIVLCTILEEDDRTSEIGRQRFPEHAEAVAALDLELFWALTQEEFQTKIPGTHMALAALEHGVGSCWVSRFEVSRLARLLALPRRYIPSNILVFGYPAETRKPTAKKRLEEVVFYDAFRGIP